jgi:hypothetical protein
MLWAHDSFVMNSDKPDPKDFSVIQFSLTIGSDGRPLQQAVPCGSFVLVEEAFEVARKLAEEEAARLEQLKSEDTETGGPKLVQLVDTEWGYDLRFGWLIVTRFWVHDASAFQPLLAESGGSSP